ncbi:uncharacterized protein BJ212DRAFT_1333058 [Suillus subaureus]|uniref:Secreted protein n=1 Tax=Suillus subaureus TaxID=48587 RepID=A0A9P7JGW4_9AGAM|nr:uncharacterized protein BJ212DRAFT_1333058 [Suillus subaureus]KAG1821725.1 hypothetical protein BJ212DRAFT_1333058 [Suillus subaureus]
MLPSHKLCLLLFVLYCGGIINIPSPVNYPARFLCLVLQHRDISLLHGHISAPRCFLRPETGMNHLDALLTFQRGRASCQPV